MALLSTPRMPPITEVVHPRGLSFAAQRKVVLLRDVHHMPWPAIAAEVRNLKKKRPSERTVRRYYRAFSRRSGRVRTKYANCGHT